MWNYWQSLISMYTYLLRCLYCSTLWATGRFLYKLHGVVVTISSRTTPVSNVVVVVVVAVNQPVKQSVIWINASVIHGSNNKIANLTHTRVANLLHRTLTTQVSYRFLTSSQPQHQTTDLQAGRQRCCWGHPSSPSHYIIITLWITAVSPLSLSHSE